MKNLTINGKLYTASEQVYNFFKNNTDAQMLSVIFNLSLGFELFEVK